MVAAAVAPRRAVAEPGDWKQKPAQCRRLVEPARHQAGISTTEPSYRNAPAQLANEFEDEPVDDPDAQKR